MIQQVNQPLQLPLLSPVSSEHLRATFSPNLSPLAIRSLIEAVPSSFDENQQASAFSGELWPFRSNVSPQFVSTSNSSWVPWTKTVSSGTWIHFGINNGSCLLTWFFRRSLTDLLLVERLDRLTRDVRMARQRRLPILFPKKIRSLKNSSTFHSGVPSIPPIPRKLVDCSRRR